MSGWEIFQNLGFFGIGVFGLAWLARKVFMHILDRDLEKFKIRYARMHGERVEVIKEVYKKISRTYLSFQSLMNPLQLAGEPPMQEKANTAAENANDLINYYEENRIFFEEELAQEIDSFLADLKEAWGKFQYSQEARNSGDTNDMLKEWRSAWEKIENKGEIAEIKRRLENKFRNIIGIE